ncbi:MAG TPA: hypothetical protein VJ876_00045, partial [Bacteroidales bacterium]|nr:hypothetical protein [Bacteroidales bacterium]
MIGSIVGQLLLLPISHPRKRENIIPNGPMPSLLKAGVIPPHSKQKSLLLRSILKSNKSIPYEKHFFLFFNDFNPRIFWFKPDTTVLLELFIPSYSKNPPKLQIKKVVHGYKDLFKGLSVTGFGQSAECNEELNIN